MARPKKNYNTEEENLDILEPMIVTLPKDNTLSDIKNILLQLLIIEEYKLLYSEPSKYEAYKTKRMNEYK